MEYPSRRRACFAGAGAMPASNANPVERLDLFLNGHSSAVAQSLFSTGSRIESISLNYVFVVALGIGIVSGLRSLTAPAVVAWCAHLGWLNLHGSPLVFMGSTPAVAIL